MKNKVPKLRFKEFSSEWKEQRLGKIGNIVTGSTPETSKTEYYDGEYLFVSPIDIKSNRYIKNTKTTLTELGFNKGRKIPKMSICFVCIGSTIGKVAQVLEECITNQQINSIIPFKDISNNFIYSCLENKSDKIKLLAGEQAVPLINKSDFSKINIFIPTFPEQEKIGNFLSSVDIKIEKLEKKKELLSQYKKGMMQKLFSQKLRFKDENGNDYPEWIKSKLGKLLIEFSIKSTKENEFSLLSSTTKGMELRNGRVDSSSNIGYKILKRNQIVFSPQNLWLGNINLNKEFETGIVSPSYKTFELNSSYIIHDYAAYLIKTPKLMYEYGLVSETGASVVRRNLNRELFDEIVVSIPSIPEQEKIANFLSSIDRKIELIERELEKNKKFKKGLLQQMFV